MFKANLNSSSISSHASRVERRPANPSDHASARDVTHGPGGSTLPEAGVARVSCPPALEVTLSHSARASAAQQEGSHSTQESGMCAAAGSTCMHPRTLPLPLHVVGLHRPPLRGSPKDIECVLAALRISSARVTGSVVV